MLSILSMLILAVAFQWERRGKNRDIVLCIVGCMICFLPMLQAGCLSNAGAAFGMWCGWFLENRFIKFEPCRNCKEKVVRFAVGAFGILLIQTALVAALNLWMPSKYAGFFGQFALMLFIMALYPFFFSDRKRYLWGAAVIFGALILMGGVAAGKVRETTNIESDTGLSVTEGIDNPGELIPAGDNVPDAVEDMPDVDMTGVDMPAADMQGIVPSPS